MGIIKEKRIEVVLETGDEQKFVVECKRILAPQEHFLQSFDFRDGKVVAIFERKSYVLPHTVDNDDPPLINE